MRTEPQTLTASAVPRQPRSRRAGPFSIALVGLALFAGGCGSSGHAPSGVASLASPTTAPPSGAVKPDAVAYSRCMREHGVTNFPDPNSNGAIQIESHPGHEIDIASPTFKSADEACKPLLPNPVTADQQTALRAAGLKYAKCMRGHGVKDFPDPASASNNSGPQSQSQAGGSGHVISFMGSPVHDDPNDPTYKAADASCKHYMADAGGGEQSTNSSGTG